MSTSHSFKVGLQQGWDNCPKKRKKRVKPKKTLTQGAMLNIIENIRGRALEIRRKILQNCVHYITKM
jgi:hypothetical protein